MRIQKAFLCKVWVWANLLEGAEECGVKLGLPLPWVPSKQIWVPPRRWRKTGDRVACHSSLPNCTLFYPSPPNASRQRKELAKLMISGRAFLLEKEYVQILSQCWKFPLAIYIISFHHISMRQQHCHNKEHLTI